MKSKSSTLGTALKIVVVSLVLGGCFKSPTSTQLIETQPEQYAIYEDTIKLNEQFYITIHHYYSLTATVLRKESYEDAWDGEVQPFDLVLGWDKMSDNSFLEKVKIDQAGRWYYYKWDSGGIKRSDISNNSSNTHMIPANDEIKKRLSNIEEGHVYSFEGYLADLTYENGQNKVVQKSSTSRTDIGDGACERFFVEKIVKIN